MTPTNFSARIRNNIAEFDRLNAEVAAFAEAHQIHPEAVFVLELVLEEMLSNTIKYGYDDAAVHELDVTIAIKPPHLLICFEDDGREFDPRNAPEPPKDVPLQQMKIGGLGIHLVRKMSARLDYRRENGRNFLEILIPLQPDKNSSPLSGN